MNQTRRREQDEPAHDWQVPVLLERALAIARDVAIGDTGIAPVVIALRPGQPPLTLFIESDQDPARPAPTAWPRRSRPSSSAAGPPPGSGSTSALPASQRTGSSARRAPGRLKAPPGARCCSASSATPRA
jgi:hypothetical protein